MEVIGGHFSVEAEVDAGHIGGAGLGVFVGLLDGAANAAPEVRLPTGLGINGKIAVTGGLGGRVVGPVL